MRHLKPLILLLSMFTFVSLSIAQQTKKATKKNNICGASFKEDFTVLKSDPKVRHGSYSAEIAWVSEKGQYEQGKKAGIWEYFSKGKLVQQFDFSTGTFLKDTISNVIQKISTLDDNGNVIKDLDPKGLYLGGDAKLAYFVSRCLRYPVKAQEYNIQGRITLSAILTKEGELTELKAVSKLGGGLEEEGIRVFQLIPQDWVPVKVDGKVVNTKVELGCSFTLTSN